MALIQLREVNVKYCANVQVYRASLLTSANNLSQCRCSEKHQTVSRDRSVTKEIAQTYSSLSSDDNAKWHASTWYAKAVPRDKTGLLMAPEEGGKHRERNTERETLRGDSACRMSATEGPLAPC